MGDTAYNTDAPRQAGHRGQGVCRHPDNPSRTFRHPLVKRLYTQRHFVEFCFSRLNSCDRSQEISDPLGIGIVRDA
ncbi:MAG: hypothetical protein ABW023_09480 [Sphingomonas sp.]